MTTISIAMATYNGERFLQEQLDSLSAQQRLPDELVVTDDCSDDRTIQILENFRASAPFEVRISINAKRLGVNQNFSHCLSLCRGDIVFICDQDDVWGPHKLERVVSQMELEDACAGICNASVLSEDPQLNGLITFEIAEAREAPRKPTFIGGCTSALRSTFLNAALPVPEGVAYDVWLNGLAAKLGLQTVIREPLQQWRKHENNTSSYLRAAPNPPRRRDLESDWSREVVLLKQYAETIDRIARAVPVPLAVCTALKSSYLSKAETLTSRLALLKKHRPLRLFSVARLYVGGEYRQFNGARSAIGDILRRQ